MARLVLLRDGVGIHSYPLQDKPLTIGRHAASTIRLDDPVVSQNHARVTMQPDPYLDGHHEVTLEDLGSTNGTLVNGEKVSRQVLRDGDLIRIGRFEFSFDSDESDSLDRTVIYLPDQD